MATSRKKAKANKVVSVAKTNKAKNTKGFVKTLQPQLQILIGGPHGEKLMKHPRVIAAIEAAKRSIIEGHKHIVSPPYCKIITDEKSGLKINLLALPERGELGENQGTVALTTVIAGGVVYEERAHFESLTKACEYIDDFEQKQSNRFSHRAISHYAKKVVMRIDNRISPVINSVVEELGLNNRNDQASEASAPMIDEKKALKAPSRK